jgi:hypothetical protein
MVADSNKQWKKADSFYEIAAGLTNETGRRAEQLGLFQADARRFCGGPKSCSSTR